MYNMLRITPIINNPSLACLPVTIAYKARSRPAPSLLILLHLPDFRDTSAPRPSAGSFSSCHREPLLSSFQEAPAPPLELVSAQRCGPGTGQPPRGLCCVGPDAARCGAADRRGFAYGSMLAWHPAPCSLASRLPTGNPTQDAVSMITCAREGGPYSAREEGVIIERAAGAEARGGGPIPAAIIERGTGRSGAGPARTGTIADDPGRTRAAPGPHPGRTHRQDSRRLASG